MSELPTRLLRETVRAGLTPESSSGCIDTDTLAAWSDGTLSGRDRAAAEAHAASCARCQALLAAMVRSTPDAPLRTWWRPSVFGWLAPLAAAAAALVVWISIPHTSSQQPAAAEATVASAPATAPSIAEQSQPPTSRAADAARTADEAFKKGLEPKTRAALPAPATPHREKAERRPAAAAESNRSGLREAQPGASSRGLPDSAVATPLVVPPLPAAQPAPPPPPPATADAATRVNTAPASTAAASGARSASGFGAQALAKAVAAPPIVIATPDPKVFWRVLPGGAVSRSNDGATTWQPQPTGYVATLIAGSAPSPTTCWLVGAGGIVLRSTDGRTWQRVAFPEAVDLTAIRASDAANATVTAGDGRTFTTTDGGRTWQPKE
jgi:hypothetical protein